MTTMKILWRPNLNGHVVQIEGKKVTARHRFTLISRSLEQFIFYTAYQIQTNTNKQIQNAKFKVSKVGDQRHLSL